MREATRGCTLKCALMAVACLVPAWAACQSVIPALSSVSVLVEVPPSNYVYRQGGQIVFGTTFPSGGQSTLLPVTGSPGVSVGAALAITLVANVIVSGIEAAATETAREAAGLVGASIQDMDLRATAFEHLRQLAPEKGPKWLPSQEPFPQPEPVPQAGEIDPATGRPYRPSLPDPLKPLVAHAKSSPIEATLFIRVLPLFRGLEGRMYVNVAALLINQSGKTLAEWNTQLMAPEPPDLQRPEVIKWWAEGRYRQFIAQGLRAGLVPIVEEIADPALRVQRQKLAAAIPGVRMDESGRPFDPRSIYAINVANLRSTPCTLQTDQQALVYHYERTRRATELVAAAYCVNEKLSDWSQDVIAGQSWVSTVNTPPSVVARSAP